MVTKLELSTQELIQESLKIMIHNVVNAPKNVGRNLGAATLESLEDPDADPTAKEVSQEVLDALAEMMQSGNAEEKQDALVMLTQIYQART